MYLFSIDPDILASAIPIARRLRTALSLPILGLTFEQPTDAYTTTALYRLTGGCSLIIDSQQQQSSTVAVEWLTQQMCNWSVMRYRQ